MEDLAEFIALIQSKRGISIEGLMAHFAASERNDALTNGQVKNFQLAQDMFAEAGITLKWIHHANSSASTKRIHVTNFRT